MSALTRKLDRFWGRGGKRRIRAVVLPTGRMLIWGSTIGIIIAEIVVTAQIGLAHRARARRGRTARTTKESDHAEEGL